MTTALAICIVTGSWEAANAQFLGDAFFETPSLSAEPGEEVVLNVAVFAGAEAFGSADLTVSFDDTFFAVESITFADKITGVSSTEVVAGFTNLRVIAGNGTSFDRPTGVASVASIKGVVLADAGTVVPLFLDTAGVFLANRTEVTSDGLGGEIVVRDPSRSSWTATGDGTSDPDATERAVEAPPGSELFRRARRVRPDAPVVKLAMPDGSTVGVIPLEME